MSYTCVIRGDVGRPDDGKEVTYQVPSGCIPPLCCLDCGGTLQHLRSHVCEACGSRWGVKVEGPVEGEPLVTDSLVRRARFAAPAAPGPEYFRFSEN